MPNNQNSTHVSEDFLANISCLLLIHDEFDQEGLRGLLANRGVKEIITAPNPEKASDKITAIQPQVILISVGDSQYSISTLTSLQAIAPNTAFVVLCEPTTVRLLLPIVTKIENNQQAGTTLLLRTAISNGNRIKTAIQEAVYGPQSLSEEIVNVLLHSKTQRTVPLNEFLSQREYQVLDLAAAGASNAKIARTLNMSRPTVGNILTRVFAKMGFRADTDTNLRMMACRELFQERGLVDSQTSTEESGQILRLSC